MPVRTQQNSVLSGVLQRAKRFIAETAAQLTSAVDLTGARTRLDDLVASLTAHAVEHITGSGDSIGVYPNSYFQDDEMATRAAEMRGWPARYVAGHFDPARSNQHEVYIAVGDIERHRRQPL